MYKINPKTGGICSMEYFMSHSCEKCPRRGMCEFVQELGEKNELSKKNEQSNNKKKIKIRK